MLCRLCGGFSGTKTPTMLIHALPYHHDSSLLFERIAHQPWATLLDSGQMLNASTGMPGSQYGRYDILVAEPFITLVTTGEHTEVSQNGEISLSNEDPFLILKTLLGQYQASVSSFPFAGGALGYFGYDLGRRLEKLPSLAQFDAHLPDMMIGIYDWAVVVDHREKTCHLVSSAFQASTKANWSTLCAHFEVPYQTQQGDNPFIVTSPVQSNLPEPQYKRLFILWFW